MTAPSSASARAAASSPSSRPAWCATRWRRPCRRSPRPTRSRSSAIKTTGDVIQDRPLSEAGGKGLFVKEIEEALLSGRIDAAVHSMKDMPTAQPAGLVISAFLPREDARDVLIAGDVERIADLKQGAIVGTVRAAPARAAPVPPARPADRDAARQCRHAAGQARGRRGRGDPARAGRPEAARPRHVGTPVPEDEMLPAVGQGAVCIECRDRTMPE